MQSDFSYIVAVDELSLADSKYAIEADLENLDFLTNLLKVEKVRNFSAEVITKLNRKQNILDVRGCVKASVELQSVVSLENFVKKYDFNFDVKFNTSAVVDAKFDEELELGLDIDVVETIVDGKIDLAMVAFEQLALLIDDHPRMDGEVFSYDSSFVEEGRKNPFEILAKLKK